MNQFSKMLIILFLSTTSPQEIMPVKLSSLFKWQGETKVGFAYRQSGSTITVTNNNKTLLTIENVPQATAISTFHFSDSLTIKFTYDDLTVSITCAQTQEGASVSKVFGYQALPIIDQCVDFTNLIEFS